MFHSLPSLSRRIQTDGPTRLISPHRRSAFTLIEMIVMIGIILVLTTLVVVSVNVAASSDRVPGSARQVQSYLEGARDRSIFANEPRGVRFLLNDEDNTVVTSLVYIGAPDSSEGVLTIENDGQTLTLNGGGDSWSQLESLGLLLEGARIRISNGSTMASNALWYSIEALPSAMGGDQLRISRQHVDYPGGSSGADVAYELALAPAVLPDHEPVQLSAGIVIDLDNSRVPGSWKFSSNYTNSMDVMFSPRGSVTGPAASAGVIHLLLRDVRDVTLGVPPGEYDNPERQGDERIVSIFTRTGHISIHPVKQGDLFFYSETGEVSE